MSLQAIRDALAAHPDAGYPAVTAEELRAALAEAEALPDAVRDWFACLLDSSAALRERDARVREAALQDATRLCDEQGTIDGDLLGHAIRALRGGE